MASLQNRNKSFGVTFTSELAWLGADVVYLDDIVVVIERPLHDTTNALERLMVS